MSDIERLEWLLIIHGSAHAVADARQAFETGDWRISIEGENAFLSAPEFRKLESAREVFDCGSELLEAINLARAIVAPQSERLTAGGAAERHAGGVRRHFITKLEPARFYLRGMPVELTITGPSQPPVIPKLPFSVRIAKAVRASRAVETAAAALSQRPLTWAALFVAYETINGLTSRSGKRADSSHYQGLGWAEAKEIIRFRRTAHLYRHGLPQLEEPPSIPMPFAEAESLIRHLFDHMMERRSE